MIKDDKLKVRHARNGGEVKIGKYFVDGYDKDTDTINEFDGCWYHSCPSMCQRYKAIQHILSRYCRECIQKTS